MIGELRLKVCGITSAGDAELAEEAGADYLGFILYPESPRGITSAQFGALMTAFSPGGVLMCASQVTRTAGESCRGIQLRVRMASPCV